MTPFNWVLLLLMAFGGVSLIARFALGLGGSTRLSDTYPWGLWILFDLVWIAVAAGAFAMAGVIYIFQRKDLYGLGRTAVLMGLLSYSFVMVTLIADLGLPWHSYQLALQAPGHSAMFEVSWCVGLYVTILLLEFLPVPFERWGFQRAMAAWRRWNGAYVAGAVTLFVYLLSRSFLYALATAVTFGALAWIFRARDKKAEADHARNRGRHAVEHASELARLPVSADAKHARPAMVVPRDACLLLSVVDCGRHCTRDPHRHVDREGMAPLARDHAARIGRTDHLLGASRLFGVSPWGYGAPQPVLRSLRRKARHGLRSRGPSRWRASARPIGTQVASAACRRAFLRGPPRGPRRGLQPHERRSLRDDLSGPDALAGTRGLRAFHSRVGDFDRPDRRDDLPVRARRATHANPYEGRGLRRIGIFTP